MGKLIDAEWLKKYVRKVGIYCDTDADKEYTCKKIDEFPTIEAIPIEWIKKWMDRQNSWNREGVITLMRDWNERREE